MVLLVQVFGCQSSRVAPRQAMPPSNTGHKPPEPLIAPGPLNVGLIRRIHSHEVPRRNPADCIHLHGKVLDTLLEDPKVAHFIVAIDVLCAFADEADVVLAVVFLPEGNHLGADQIAKVKGWEAEEVLPGWVL